MSENGKRFLYLALVTLLICGCSPFRPDNRNLSKIDLPKTYSLYSENGTTSDEWWKNFGSTDLDILVKEALEKNFDIRKAWARLKQANAAAVQAGADKLPSLNGNADYSYRKTGSENSASKKITETENHELGLTAAYEFDFWGRVEAQAKAGELNAFASREDVNAAAMTVAAEVVSRWIEIQTRREEIKILLKQVETNRTYLDLLELRFRNSLATALDVFQQREQVARIKAKIPPIEARERTLINELALLLGRPAGTLEVAEEKLPELPPKPESGIPSKLLAYRPDVRAAGIRVRSSDWDVAEARANRLPSFTISANSAFIGEQLTTLFNGWALGLAASITGPIFDGGYRSAEVDKSRAVVQERLEDYKSVVYTALNEVENAMINETWQEKYIAATEDQLKAARNNFNEAGSRYLQGLEDYLPVLSGLSSVQDLELNLAGDRGDLLLYRVELYRSLGGGWTERLKNPLPETGKKAESAKDGK
jgi:NodT family efflux transporter outer membrane factor (OMF) lipoprotein